MELPAELPKETLKKLENTRISGVLINLRPEADKRRNVQSGGGKPRKRHAG